MKLRDTSYTRLFHITPLALPEPHIDHLPSALDVTTQTNTSAPNTLTLRRTKQSVLPNIPCRLCWTPRSVVHFDDDGAVTGRHGRT